MQMKFFGAAKNVTGSCYLLHSDDRRFLIDCGLYQERRYRDRNWDPFPVDPRSIHGVLLTHAHLDHCGRLPKLVKEGFRGPIYGTKATLEIAKIVLRDSAHIQREDAEFKRLRHQREGRTGRFPEVPLYTLSDVEDTLSLFQAVSYEQPVELDPGMNVTFRDAGHIFGSSMLAVKISEDHQEKTILFSGDIGRWDKPIINDPTSFTEADYIIMESTYGDRVHEDVGDIETALSEVVNGTKEAGGNIVIPSFAIERAQELLFYLNKLLMADEIPHILVFVDSPMAVSVTRVFEKNPGLFDREMQDLIKRRQSPFHFFGLQLVRSVEESKAINHLKGTAIIIAGSGMCTGGRIKHHLVHNIEREESTILFVGYQAEGTLGRHILSEPPEVRILGRTRKVRARIARINGLSAHADSRELMRWLSTIRNPPKALFLVHGESHALAAMEAGLREQKGWKVTVPDYLDEVELD
jgi:metallo-beta-lactamase family protein